MSHTHSRTPKRQGSLRLRLLRGTSVAVTTVFGVAGCALYFSLRATLVNEFDEVLTAKARALASLVEQGSEGVKLELDPGQLPEFLTREHAEFYELRMADGSVRARSPSLENNDLPRVARPGTVAPTKLSGGRSARAITLVFVARVDEELSHPPADPVSLTVARDTAPLDHLLRKMGMVLAGVFALATGAATAVMAYVVRRGLWPAAALAAEIAAVSTNDLKTRVSNARAPAELLPLVDRLNDLLGRLDAALDREKAFTADVAHELRTPLAGLTAALEVCVSRPREPAAYEQTARRCLRTTRDMASMVENLLLLARADASELLVGRAAVNLSELLERQWGTFSELAGQRKLQVSFDVSPDILVLTDATLLGVVLRNLIENAVDYCDAGGTVRVLARDEETKLLIEVENTGSKLPTEDSEKVFDRFWRGDVSRSAGNTRCGIGLPLCRRLVEILGGSIKVLSASGLFVARATLPFDRNAAPVSVDRVAAPQP